MSSNLSELKLRPPEMDERVETKGQLIATASEPRPAARAESEAGRRSFWLRHAGVVAFVVHALRTVKVIVQTKPEELRWPVARTYWWLSWEYFLCRVFPQRRIRSGKLLGHRFEFFDVFSVVCMFETVFVRQDYAFHPQNERPVILDCGSNIGVSVLYFKHRWPESRVTAFEPDRPTFTLLSRNMAANGWKDVALMNKAVCAAPGEVNFYSDPNLPGSTLMSTLAERGPSHAEKVEGVTLSQFIDREIDFAKIDIEGAETGVLEEVTRAGKLRQIREMAIEYHHHIRADEDHFSRVLRLLEENGFGYEIASWPEPPMAARRVGDILIYAYRKD